MFTVEKYSQNKDEAYLFLIKQLHSLLEGERNVTANLANASSLLNQFLENTNWVGFYLYEDAVDELVLGPFQGLPACVRIPLGKGVCGSAARDQKTYVVADVHQFPGHIACDSASRSEIVVPIIKEGKLIGVLDIDSPITNRFDEKDKQYLEQFVAELISYL
ncbi:GAF domain-containing protein [Fictibacillus sp. Mic-4]|uniref:GAF domain-containing protein n=1 Tax=Fictibacillus sp. Mic-4 TaxID=3132826 RepID=UPI003CF0F38B